jgi:hypothetical protein
MTFNELVATIIGQTFVGKYTDALERPTREEIARLAYHFYEARGRREGHALEDWLSAERELEHHYR